MPIRPDYLLLSMPACPAAAGLARTVTRARLDKWGYSHISDDAFLIVSELINNAVSATPGAHIRYQLSRDDIDVLLAVWDSSPHIPVATTPADLTPETLDLSPENWDDNGGWGLPIVAAVSIACGCTPDPDRGKWVWARLKP